MNSSLFKSNYFFLMSMDRTSSGISVAVYFLINLLALTFIGNLIKDNSSFFLFIYSNPFTTIIIIVISFFLSMLIHELGHLLMGKLMGFKLIEIKVWFLSFSRIDNESKNSLQFKFKTILSFSGFTFMNPSEIDNFIARQIIFLSGGILFNLLAILIVTLYYSSIIVSNSLFQSFLIIFAFLQLFLIIINTFPLHSNDNLFDGRKIFNIFVNEPFKNSLIIDSLNIKGIRPKEWLQYGLFKSYNHQLTEYDFSLKFYELLAYMDEKDQEKSSYIINQLLESIKYSSLELHDSICIHCALYYSFVDFQIDKVEECIHLIRNKFNPSTVSRTFLGIIQSKIMQNNEQLQKNFLKLLDLLTTSPMKGTTQFYSDLLRQ